MRRYDRFFTPSTHIWYRGETFDTIYSGPQVTSDSFDQMRVALGVIASLAMRRRVLVGSDETGLRNELGRAVRSASPSWRTPSVASPRQYLQLPDPLNWVKTWPQRRRMFVDIPIRRLVELQEQAEEETEGEVEKGGKLLDKPMEEEIRLKGKPIVE